MSRILENWAELDEVELDETVGFDIVWIGFEIAHSIFCSFGRQMTHEADENERLFCDLNPAVGVYAVDPIGSSFSGSHAR